MTKQARVETVAEAQRILTQLEERRAAVVARGQELATIRASYAYAAHANSDAAARAKLDQVNRETAEHGSELASIDGALATARQKLDLARQREALETDRTNARELKVVLDRFVQTATQLDAALVEVAALGHNLHQIQARMRELGSPGAEWGAVGFAWLSVSVDGLRFDTVVQAL